MGAPFDSRSRRALVPALCLGALLLTVAGLGNLLLGSLAAVIVSVFYYRQSMAHQRAHLEKRNLALIAERTSNGVVLTNPQGEIEWVNEGFERMTGYSLSEVLGRKPGTFLQGAGSSAEAIRKMREGLARSEGFHLEILNYRKDRSPYWADVEVRPIFGEDGRIEHYMAIEADVTSRHIADENLKNLTNQLLEAQSIGKLACIQFYVRGQEFEWNDQAAQLLHLKAQNNRLSFENFLNRILLKDRSAVRTSFHQSIRDRKELSIEFQFVKDSDLVCDIHLRMRPLFDEDGDLSRFLGIFEDVSEHKEAGRKIELAMKQAQEGEAAKGQFLAILSHEIRTPLNGVLGFAELLSLSKLDSQQREHVDFILSSGRMLLEILNDILDYSKIESAKLDLEFKPFSLPQILHSLSQIMSPLAEKKGNRLQCQIDSDVPEFFVGDSSRMQQILLNMLNNAIKFTERGRIDLRVSSFKGSRGEPMIRFEVEDTGVGISPEKLAKIFEPFSQGDSTTTRKFGGSGLGLAICRRLVRLMGGKIFVDSKVGRGSKFWFEIPELRADRDLMGDGFVDLKPIEQKEYSNEGRNLRVLLVEDSDVNRRLIRLMLQKSGVHVVDVESGSEALQVASTSKFDVIFLDAELPGMDGLVLAEKLRAMPEYVGAYLVGISASSSDDDRRRSLAAGMDAFLPKPISLVGLNEVLRLAGEVLKTRRSVRQSAKS